MLPAHTCEICGAARPPATSSGRGETQQQQALWPRGAVWTFKSCSCVSPRQRLCVELQQWTSVCVEARFTPHPTCTTGSLPRTLRCCYFERCRELVQRGLLKSELISGWLLSFFFFLPWNIACVRCASFIQGAFNCTWCSTRPLRSLST